MEPKRENDFSVAMLQAEKIVGTSGTESYNVGWDMIKMAASLNSEFWRCIDELKTELQAMHRVESLCKTPDESVEKSVVKIEELSG